MKTRVRLLLVVMIFGVTISQPWLGRAYELRTHAEITRQAYAESQGLSNYLRNAGLHEGDIFDLASRTKPDQLGLFENTGTVRDWLTEGAIREDDYKDDALAALLGCQRPTNPPTETSRVFNHFFDVQRGGRGLTVPVAGQVGLPAPDWALGLQGRGSGSKENQFSLLDARHHQYQSLAGSSKGVRDKHTALLFRALGHVLHLVEDMAQPQHTRNDPHAGCMDVLKPIVGGHSWYEHYVEDRVLGRILQGSDEIPPEIVLDGYGPVPTRSYPEFFTTADRRGIADFSSRNFLTAGTNLGRGSEPCSGLVEPPCEATAYQQVTRSFSGRTLKGPISGAVTLYTRDVVDALTGDVIEGVPISSRSVWDEHLVKAGRSKKFSLNRFNHDAMADILLPRAVGYAAGFLDAFFRGSVAVTYENKVLRIWGSSEPMTGEFTLLYDKADGSRAPLATWASVSVDPDDSSAPRSAPRLPSDAAADAPCWLVFRGQLGFESGAVVGSQVPCPPIPVDPTFGGWTVYTCVLKRFGDPLNQPMYVYATETPPLASDGLPSTNFSFNGPTGFTSCGITAIGLEEQPPNTLTEHLI